MSDDGSADGSFAFRDQVPESRIKHKSTHPWTPRTNGNSERSIQTGSRERACAQPFRTSADRAAAMLPWITDHNISRPHSALNGKTRSSGPPASESRAAPTWQGSSVTKRPPKAYGLDAGHVGASKVCHRRRTASLATIHSKSSV